MGNTVQQVEKKCGVLYLAGLVLLALAVLLFSVALLASNNPLYFVFGVAVLSLAAIASALTP